VSPVEEPELDPALADAVRRAYVQPVDQGTAARHVTAMASVAAAQDPIVARSVVTWPGRIWRPALAGAAATVLLPAALAVAGVSLPRAIDRPYGALGIALPHQAHSSGQRRTPSPPVVPGETVIPRLEVQPSGAPHGRHHDKKVRRPKVVSHRSRQKSSATGTPGAGPQRSDHAQKRPSTGSAHPPALTPDRSAGRKPAHPAKPKSTGRHDSASPGQGAIHGHRTGSGTAGPTAAPVENHEPAPQGGRHGTG
jgi:hypothetical protein